MTPKEKSEELVEKFMLWKFQKCELSKKQAKQCALIAVDEIIYSHSQDTTDNQFYYWQEVKQEIENL
jgi:hypothetical protein